MENTCFLDIFNENFPPLSVTAKNISKSWCAWKQEFLSFLKKKDAKELYKNQWITFLLMLIGPLGEQAYKDISSKHVGKVKDLQILLRALDLYFIFGTTKKQPDQSIDQYIDSLMIVAIASNHSDPVSIVKEKIIEDITSCNFTGKAIVFVQSKGDDVVAYLQLLDLHKITDFWKQCQKLMLQTNYQNILKSSSNPCSIIAECVRCGTQHRRNQCPAHGVQCNNCKRFNHFTDNCKVTHIRNCTKCGTNHVQSRCIAFGVLCTKCGKTNHFSWKCSAPFVKNCSRCGMDHVISACPAQGRICSRCNKPNHIEEQCVSRQ